MRRLLSGLVMGLVLGLAGCECGSPSIHSDGGRGGGAQGGGTAGGGAQGGGEGSGGGTATGGGGADSGCGLVTCASAQATCGLIGDGCGAVLDCGTCSAPETCGGGAVPSQCGGDAGCVPVTCAQLGAECGPMADRCGGLLDCGSCAAPETCGGGGLRSRCGTPGPNISDGGACVPTTCAAEGATCGVLGDGCGGLTDSCGTCTAPQVCGLGGPNRCGTACQPRTVTELHVNCGPVSDGCGNLLDAGTCTDGGTCGGGGQANVCGAPPPCVARTCQQQGATCGRVADGCGGLTVDCGPCTAPDICGGGGVPSVCGSRGVGDAGACVNLCPHQQACSGTDGGTTLSGRVVAPTQADAGYGQPDPIPGALVYVPNGTVQPFSADAGVTCDQCADGVSGDPLVSTYTKTDGTFTLRNVPCGVPVPVVIQLGKWRRQVTVSAPACCQANTMTQEQTRLPRKQAEGHPNDNIPRIAVVTGDVDVIECVLPKLGIAADQYSLPSGNGRVRFYQDNGQGFAGAAPGASTLFDSLAEMKKHDMIILDCVGAEERKSPQQRRNMEAYANAGGRIFASHYAYVWLFDRSSASPSYDPFSFSGTARWNVRQTEPNDQDARIDTSFEKGSTFAEWVDLVDAEAITSTPTTPRIRINTVRHDLDAVIPPAQRWVFGTPGDGGIPFQYTFNTPVDAGAADQCGRVLFSDFHVINANNSWAHDFPGACSTGPMTPQEKVFEYLLFDLSSCIRPDDAPPQTCTPTTCQAHGFTCGWIGDGCGGTLNCGSCTAPQTCGGGGQPNVCGIPSCVPLTCQGLGATCGQQGNGCGGILDCGTCTLPQTCGGGGTPNVCGGSCAPKSCQDLGFNCGPQADGCGGVIQCGDCPQGQTCGGAGVPGVCGASSCAPLTCVQQSISCGPAGDGCGGVIQCGDCPQGQSCGGAGVPGQCGAPTCVPRTCESAGADCGALGDGCGHILECGTCPPDVTCGGGGIPNVCGGIG